MQFSTVLVLLYLAIWLVQKTRTILSTSQIENYKLLAAWSRTTFSRFTQCICDISFPINGSSDYFHLCSVRYTRADQNQLRYETLKRRPMKNENYSLSAFYFRYHPRLILRGQKSQHKIPGTFSVATLTFSYFRGAFICLIISVHLSRKISLSCVLFRVNNFDEFCFVSLTKVLLVLTVVRMNCMVEILIPC